MGERMLTKAKARRILTNVSEGEFAEATLDVLRAYGRAGQWLKLAQVAALAEMSVRSYQRRLSEEQGTFTKLVDQVRTELATEMLSDTLASVAQVAELLGYFNQGDFSRAWKRRSGTTPDEFRRAQRASKQRS